MDALCDTDLSGSETSENLPKSPKEAQRLNSLVYFTGKPCSHGHIAPRYTSCNVCLVCHNIKVRRLRKKNPEAHRAAVRRWRLRNPEDARKRSAAWARLNPERKKIHALKFRQKYREEAKERTRLWRDLDPDRAKRSRNESARRNPETGRKARHKRRAALRAAPGHHTTADLKEILRLQKHRCAYCSKKFTRKRYATLDHIVPLACGGSNDRTNLQFLCAPCNSGKGIKDALQYVQSLGKLI